MFELTKLLFEICLFKKGPQDLPFSNGLLRLLLVADVIVSSLMVSIHTGWLASLLQAIVSVLLIIGFSWLMLYITQKRERFNQTTSAFFG
jgi:hypothetical protein